MFEPFGAPEAQAVAADRRGLTLRPVTTTAKHSIRTGPQAILAAVAYGFGLSPDEVIALARNSADFGPITTLDDAVAALLSIDDTITPDETAPRSLTETIEWLLEVGAPTCCGCGQDQTPLERTGAWTCRTDGCPLQAEETAADLAGTPRDSAAVTNGGATSDQRAR